MIARRRGIARSAVRLAAGTAVMAGTAGAVRHHQEQRYANQAAEQQAAADAQYDAQAQDAQVAQMQQQMAAQQQQIEQMKAQQAAPPPSPAAAAPANDLNSQLTQLAQLHSAGVLNDQEFAQAKAKLLSGG